MSINHSNIHHLPPKWLVPAVHASKAQGLQPPLPLELIFAMQRPAQALEWPDAAPCTAFSNVLHAWGHLHWTI